MTSNSNDGREVHEQNGYVYVLILESSNGYFAKYDPNSDNFTIYEVVGYAGTNYFVKMLSGYTGTE